MAKKKTPSKSDWYTYPVRRGQLVSPFGIGAMIDFPAESVMVAGLDEWPEDDCPEVHDERLATRLGVDKLRLPPAKPDDSSGEGAEVPAVRFPLWHQCPRSACRTLMPVSWNERRVSFCTTCKLEKRKAPRVVPLRFAVACDAGHISDFPWAQWAHKQGGEELRYAKVCDQPRLKLYSTDRADLGGLYVKCVACDSGRSLAGATGEQGIFGFDCPGEQPWLGPNARKKCTRPPHMVQRGASNVYFAEVVSSILIPPFSSRYYQLLQDPMKWAMLTTGMKPDGAPSPEIVKLFVSSSAGLDPAKLVDFVRLKISGKLKGSPDQPEPEYRLAEYKALCQPEKQDDEQFSAEVCERSMVGEGVAAYINKLVRVDRLAETRALVGISRLDGLEKAPLSLNRKNWLPANRVYGEGIFLTLEEKRLEKWSGQKAVADRAATLTDRYRQVQATRKRVRFRNLLPKFYLLHTLAHVLIRQLSFECGYGSSSLRERIYCNEDDNTGMSMSGFLIYTAAGDCEGTLGGLVRQSEPETFGRLVRDALQSALWCSADPLCIESKGQGADSLNLASCYACTLLPETSCEEGNRLLDRAFLVGTPDNPGIGFFSDLLS